MSYTSRTSTRVYDSPARDAVLTSIRELVEVLGHSPSETAIAEHRGVARRTVRDHLVALEELGHIRRTPGKSRTIVLLDDHQARAS